MIILLIVSVNLHKFFTVYKQAFKSQTNYAKLFNILLDELMSVV